MSGIKMYAVPPAVTRDGGPPPKVGMYAVRSPHAVAGEVGGAAARPGTPPRSVLEQVSDMSKTVRPESGSALEERQARLVAKLETLRSRIESMKRSLETTREVPRAVDLPRDVVLNVNPASVPHSLLALKRSLGLRVRCHTHSSVRTVPEPARQFSRSVSEDTPENPSAVVTLIWKAGVDGTELVSGPRLIPLVGEVNAARYLMAAFAPTVSRDEPETDSLLDACHLFNANGDARAFDGRLKRKIVDTKARPTTADVCAWSALKRLKNLSSFSSETRKWFTDIDARISAH